MTTTALDIDHLAASNELYELAERYQLEAEHWTPTMRAAIERHARLLAEHARAALTGRLDIAEAYIEGGTTLLNKIRGCRHLIEGITR